MSTTAHRNIGDAAARERLKREAEKHLTGQRWWEIDAFTFYWRGRLIAVHKPAASEPQHLRVYIYPEHQNVGAADPIEHRHIPVTKLELSSEAGVDYLEGLVRWNLDDKPPDTTI